MNEEISEEMNLDLNLGPSMEQGSGTITSDVVNLEDWMEEPVDRISDDVRLRNRQRWRWRQVPIPPETRGITMRLDELMASSGNGGNGRALQASEGSVTPDERATEAPKGCENNEFLEDGALDNKDGVEKGDGCEESFFDCNICFDLARDPVITCCGHLFCWPCLYCWINVHSDAKECPVCKGEVTIKNVTPIYGRGNNNRVPEEDPSLNIPLRPQARRVESWRQTIQRNALTFPVEEMIRRLGNRFVLSRDVRPVQDNENGHETSERHSSLVNRILTSRGMRREQTSVPPPDEVVDLTHSGRTSPDAGETRRFRSLLLRRAHSHRAATLTSLSSALNSAERVVESYFRSHPTSRNQEQSQPVDDRDSFSSIAAVINSDGQTVDTALEIDSLLSHSTSSSRRRNDGSRISDVDSGDSRPPRRRRLN